MEVEMNQDEVQVAAAASVSEKSLVEDESRDEAVPGHAARLSSWFNHGGDSGGVFHDLSPCLRDRRVCTLEDLTC
ncbi:protein of unknown function [Candidatus Filomicrobium marinum]|uniref:Uncharacterized protein n=1 Tax=Candidatus Filomicrobium marinum TaxID=1608628 RepID=A0A0D6JH02_9HYPH|nr:protein of unknown function [Candidatus Filomicrobium marinum]CPR20511.1 protein of unknown function [Candidatus Filomicrobium marinum]